VSNDVSTNQISPQSQASPAVIDLIARTDANNIAQNNLSDKDDASLAAMEALIANLRASIHHSKSKTATPILEDASATAESGNDEDVDMIL